MADPNRLVLSGEPIELQLVCTRKGRPPMLVAGRTSLRARPTFETGKAETPSTRVAKAMTVKNAKRRTNTIVCRLTTNRTPPSTSLTDTV